MCLLALDLGSTNLKGAIFSSGLDLFAQASIPVTYSTWQDPIVEIDPKTFWSLLVELVRRLCNSTGLSPINIDNIAISSQAQTFILLDRDLQPLTPLISWIDRRGEAYSSRLEQSLGPNFHQHCSFPSSIPELQVSKLYYLHMEQPGLLQRAALVASLAAWLSLRLGAPPILDRNLAAMSGLYSLQTGNWHLPALELSGLQLDQLPLLVDCGAASTAETPQGFLTILGDSPVQGQSKTISFHSCGNDQTCGALAAGLQPGEVLLTLGTALVAYRLAGAVPGPYSPAGCWGPYPGGGYYELTVSTQGTSALDWALREFFPTLTPDDLAHLAGSLSGTAGGTTPFFYPQEMGSPRAFSHKADPAALAYAVYEGLSFSLRQLLDSQIGVSPALLRASGGGSRSDYWLQVISDVTGVPVQPCTGLAGSPLLGAALQVCPDQPQTLRTRLFLPDSAQSPRLSERYQQWLSFRPCVGGMQTQFARPLSQG